MEGDQGREGQAALCHWYEVRRALRPRGIWENWRKPGSEEWIRRFAVTTTTANELVNNIHDRMPVIIPPESYDRWLSSIEPDPRDLLVPFPATLITMWPISTRVNKPDNDDVGTSLRHIRLVRMRGEELGE